MNLLGENPATELEDINQEIADLQKDILAGVKAHWDVTELAEKGARAKKQKDRDRSWADSRETEQRTDR